MELVKYLIGLDLGTSAIKGVLMTAEGQIISRKNKKTEYVYPAEGYVEFDINRFYSLVAGVIKGLTADLPEGGLIAGISMASASGNTVLLDSDMKPLHQCISWMDSRTQGDGSSVSLCEDTEEPSPCVPCVVYEVIGWPLLKKFPLAHLSWLRCHKPEILQSAEKVCMSTDYLNYRLTGKWGIDQSTATTFYLMDQKNGRWYEPFLRSLDIPEWKLPEIYPSGTVLGTVTEEAAEDTGLSAGTPLILGAFDHPCAARGAGVIKEGQMLLSCGTSWVGFYPVNERRLAIAHNMLVDPYLSPNGPWGAMTSIPEVGNIIERYICKYISDRDDRYSEFDRLAASANPCPKGLLINPLLELESQDLKNFSKAEIARALMEGTAFLFKMQEEQNKNAGIKAASAVMVGGPSEAEPWPQILCDILGFPLTSINGSCAGAVGAAIIAGIGTGLYKNEEDAFVRLNFPETVYKPDVELQNIYDAMYHKFVEFSKSAIIMQ